MQRDMPQRPDSVTRKNEAGAQLIRPALIFRFPSACLCDRAEHPLDVAVSMLADARHHGRAVEFDNQEQGFYRSPPLLEILLGLGKLLDIVGGVLERDELTTAGQGNRRRWTRT